MNHDDVDENCQNCDYRRPDFRENGYCYMFRGKPEWACTCAQKIVNGKRSALLSSKLVQLLIGRTKQTPGNT